VVTICGRGEGVEVSSVGMSWGWGQEKDDEGKVGRGSTGGDKAFERKGGGEM